MVHIIVVHVVLVLMFVVCTIRRLQWCHLLLNTVCFISWDVLF